MTVLFISGIDTDIGKTIATGQLAKALYQKGHKVITQKLVQTGCHDIAEDLITHRNTMGMPLQRVDKEGTTCPYVFSKPASPHLSSALEHTIIEPDIITAATDKLLMDYDIVLLEGAGGLMVPITDSVLSLDYIAKQGYPIVLVTSGRLGSINHTLLSIEAIESRSLTLHALIYNQWQPNSSGNNDLNYLKDEEIVDSTRHYLLEYLQANHPQTYWVDLPDSSSEQYTQDFDTDNPFSLTSYAKVLAGIL
ncbi:dethiobiotin synthase [Psychrobacter sp. DM4]|uniref:dethiobiotin synthase n=1 Tax=Psychrobacter sp. DM4 TaxID=3440637 RepID=UPI003F502190